MSNLKHVAILVHGFNVKNRGEDSTDKLRPYLELNGIEVIELDYQWTFILGAWWYNRKLSQKLAEVVSDCKAKGKVVTVIGHSNGCAIAYLMLQKNLLDMAADLFIFLNPALKRDVKFSDMVKRVVVFHSPSDHVVGLARKLRKTILCPFRKHLPWGNMGQIGHQGDDPRVTNINLEQLIEACIGKPVTVGHSDIFKDGRWLRIVSGALVGIIKREYV